MSTFREVSSISHPPAHFLGHSPKPIIARGISGTSNQAAQRSRIHRRSIPGNRLHDQYRPNQMRGGRELRSYGDEGGSSWGSASTGCLGARW
jgi:hypothetical protein